MRPEVTARAAAVALLTGVLDDGKMLSSLFENGGPLAELSPAERARAQRLASGVLRHIGQLDKALRPLLRKAPPEQVLHILRLGTLELAEGGAPHGIVSDLVNLAKSSSRTEKFAPLVNAVLRKHPVPMVLVGENRLPEWLRQPLVATYSRRGVEAMERVWSKSPPIDITTKPGCPPIEGALVLENGSLRFPAGVQVSALPGYAEGQWWVQDVAASMPVQMLGDVAGLRVLDLCAAPGGKTMQLAALGAQVTALDASPARMARLTANLARTGLAAQVIIADGLDYEPDAGFDAILLDAPCSATGTIRRHPDLAYVKAPDDLNGLVDLQARLIDRALGWLRPGGRLVYSTCSLLPQEGEDHIRRLLDPPQGVSVVRPDMPWIPEDWWSDEGLRLRPDYWSDRGGMDGFFMACLQANSR